MEAMLTVPTTLADHSVPGASSRRLLWTFLLAVGLCSGLTSCLSPAKNTGVAHEAHRAGQMSLRDRAERLWSARQAEDWRAVYEFEDPQLRASSNAEEFEVWSKENEPFRVVSFEIRDVEESGELGWVNLSTQVGVRRFPSAPVRDVQRWETWRRLEGGWLPIARGSEEQYPIAPSRRDAEAEKALRTRYEESWRARRDADWKALYALVDPNDRGTVDEVSFAESMDRLRFLETTVQWVQVVGNEGVIRVDYRHRFNDPNLTKMVPRNLALNEEWVRVEGTWFLDLKR